MSGVGRKIIGRTGDEVDMTDVVATSLSVSALNAVPPAANATGTTGQIRFTADYIYVCIATNVWKRSPLSTWR